jgi:hypothetical protein
MNWAVDVVQGCISNELLRRSWNSISSFSSFLLFFFSSFFLFSFSPFLLFLQSKFPKNRLLGNGF